MPKKYTLEITFQKPIVAEIPQQTTIIEAQRVAVRLVYPARVRYPGHISGQQYIWEKIGDVVPVLPEDVPYLLEKRLGKGGCCGAGGDGNKLFELAQGGI
jgi:hypothetical protein